MDKTGGSLVQLGEPAWYIIIHSPKIPGSESSITISAHAQPNDEAILSIFDEVYGHISFHILNASRYNPTDIQYDEEQGRSTSDCSLKYRQFAFFNAT